jgi:hypothetical protein
MSEIRVDRIVDSTGNSPVIYLDPNSSEVRIGTGITFNTITNQIILGDTAIGDISGNANFSGILTAAAFVGDGSGLTNIVSTGSGVEVRDNGSVVGTASTIDFGDNLTVSFGAGIVTVTSTSAGGGASDFVRTSAGIHTLGNVGVGTTNPTTALEINGTLGFRTFSAGLNISIGNTTTGSSITPSLVGEDGLNNIFMGIDAGKSTTTGRDNIFLGRYSGCSNTDGFSNNFLGWASGCSNTTGCYNTFFGTYAGSYNTTGGYNIFFGSFSGLCNTTGYGNNFLGYSTGQYNTTGSYNSFFGKSAGESNTTGCYNAFFGNYSSLRNTTGCYNSSFGVYSAQDTTSGSYNSSFGDYSASNNTTGNYNLFLGGNTGISTSASYKVIVGSGSAGFGGLFDSPNTTKDMQFAVGVKTTTSSSSKYWITGDENMNLVFYNSVIFNNDNIKIGYFAGGNAVGGGNNVFIGYGAGYSNSGACDNNFIGNGAGYYNTTGEFNSFFGEDSGNSNTIGCSNSFFGRMSGCCNTTGSRNSFFGTRSGSDNRTGSHNVFLGAYSGISTASSNKVIIGVGTVISSTRYLFDSPDTTRNTQLAIGARTDANPSNYWLVGDENFNVGIGTTNPTSKLQVGGTVTASAFVGDGSGLTNLPSGGGGASDFVRTSAGIHTLGNVGLGTTNPTTALSVNGVISFRRDNIRLGGSTTGSRITTGNDNVFMGVGAGSSTTTGDYNNFIGYLAGYYNTSGNSNNFFGCQAGYFNTLGVDNNFFGSFAGYSNIDGVYNNFIGCGAGFFNTTGRDNNFFGSNAGYSNTTGEYNNFIGSSAGLDNTTGCFNNFFGLLAGQTNTTGNSNNFFGNSAGYYNTTGNDNNFLGDFSGGYNTTGSSNFFGGDSAGYCNITGNFNTFLGSYSGISTSASNKIILGRGNTFNYLFDAPDTTKNTQFAVGVRTDANLSKYWLVGNENFNIGIGTTNPTEKLSVGGNISLNQTTVYGSVQASTASTSVTGIHSGLSTSVYRSVEYTIQATQGTNYQAVKILVIHDGTTAYDTQYGNIYNTEVATFDVDISGGNVRLVAAASSTSTTNYTVNFIATRI